ncbi:TetR/AcrR family transcriptional regulator, partial [Staphylococcus succinus]
MANLKSKTKIQNALVDCLNKTRMSSMSVKMICDEAQVNRSTFYRHYDSIDSAISITISAYFSLLFGEPYKFYLK